MNRISKILGPLTADPHLVNANSVSSKSTKLFSDAGLVRLYDGKTVLLPLVVRSMRKLEAIIREEMSKVSAHEILLPILVSESILKATGHDRRDELFRLTDRTKKTLILSPTSEESITHVMASQKNMKHTAFPLRLYQINTKFRDEAHPKHGLIRCKEFIMKDLYCFDTCPETRQATYNEVRQQYHRIFERIQIPYECALSSGSELFSGESHEFHFLSDIGEDELVLCKNCGINKNVNLVKRRDKCDNCLDTNVQIVKGIEVGHSFNIGTTYSEKLDAKYVNGKGESNLIEMSCYGIGVSRILAASTETLCTEKELRWPLPLAPYSVCIIPPKAGSKEEEQAKSFVHDIYSEFERNLNGDVVLDDRDKYTIGKKVLNDRKLGFPFIVIFGKEIMGSVPKVEIIDLNANQSYHLEPSQVVGTLLGKIRSKVK